MKHDGTPSAAGHENARRLFVFNGGFLTQSRIHRILELSGWSIALGKPSATDWVGVWGKSPTSPRGEAVAERTDANMLRVEDAFLRSVLPGRSNHPPIGLTLDETGVHFDSSAPSDLETLLATHPLDDTALLNRARDAAERLRRSHLSKYNAFDPDLAPPKAPYVLVIDQTQDDASIKHGGASAATFQEMLVFAQTEHPSNRIVIKTHPDTMAGHRKGHFTKDMENARITVLDDPISPWRLMEGATAVYTVSSQLGFEAIYAGHKPRVFGQPFYAGWGLTQDENPIARRERKLTRAQLFAAAMILYPTWYDPNRDCLCEIEEAIAALEAQTRAWREDHNGYDAEGISRWKHPHMQAFFGEYAPVRFTAGGADQALRKKMVWGAGKAGDDATHVEDGFVRSRGLGANLVPPLSLVADPIGIYYDPTRPSQLEHFIAASPDLPPDAITRATRLMGRLRKTNISKYNLTGAPLPDLPQGHRILVPGQVEDDASVVKGCTDVASNIDLLQRARMENPDAILIYKPHPDVEAGLRKGAIAPEIAQELADVIATNADPIALINAVDEVWTMTSLLGFEALIRSKKVTCLGVPFYAGWGLTHDLCPTPNRRNAQPTLAQFVHACLIDYPRYYDPISQTHCPVEVVLDRLETGEFPQPSVWVRLASKLQRYMRRT
ncbi:MAG: capsular polysaccharide biosynthesis protein [Marinosulfonomonas sp.]